MLMDSGACLLHESALCEVYVPMSYVYIVHSPEPPDDWSRGRENRVERRNHRDQKSCGGKVT